MEPVNKFKNGQASWLIWRNVIFWHQSQNLPGMIVQKSQKHVQSFLLDPE